MSKIKIMSENLANKIAAGEVVEKCASIVKELVENSIDAQATHIKVDLINGGLQEIYVFDDGGGMDAKDALLAFQRHATSKIYKDDDLFFINTLGFRGEALPSIASIAEVTLKTCSEEVGTYVHLKGGKLLENSACEARRGTSLRVTNLFYNTPARLKYLKMENTELSNCVAYIEKLALSKPNVSFNLTNNGKEIIKTSGSGDILKTIHEIYGYAVSSKMLEIKSNNDDFDLKGFICKPEILKSNRNHLITIVNGRVIRNNEINKAINDAYYTYKPEGKYPLVVIYIDTDPTLIDVNIHPTKQDIKMSKMPALTELIWETIKDTLYKTLLIPNVISPVKEESPVISQNNLIAENKEEYSQTQLDFAYQNVEVKDQGKNVEIKSLLLDPIGVVHGTYIVAQNEEGLFLIDQHAAQERVNYEKYLKALKEEEIQITQMLFPIKIELASSEFMIIKDNLKVLSDLGILLEEFGINTFIIKAHPAWLKNGFEEESLRKIIDLIIINKEAFDRVKFNEKIAITLACKMSIKANMHITDEEAKYLLKDLVKCDNPYNCPHGRPTIIKFSIYDLEKLFKRIMN